MIAIVSIIHIIVQKSGVEIVFIDYAYKFTADMFKASTKSSVYGSVVVKFVFKITRLSILKDR